MIPVQMQPEPHDFDKKVRQEGHAWLRKKGLPIHGPRPEGIKVKPFWQLFNETLWQTYSGICAYLAIYFEFGTGASSTDHFIPTSVDMGSAYEWSNYRLSCLGANRSKNNFEDVLDPFELARNTFIINFASGEMSPSLNLPKATEKMAEATISRLGLNAPKNMEMRANHYQAYEMGDCTLNFLKRQSPFVYHEIFRQNLVKPAD